MTALGGASTAVLSAPLRAFFLPMADCFVFGSIFFLRNVLVIWDCILPEVDNGPEFVRSEPSIVCNCDDDFMTEQCTDDEEAEYNYLYALASLGLTVYAIMFGAFAFGLTVKRDLFEFLGDKFECVMLFL